MLEKLIMYKDMDLKSTGTAMTTNNLLIVKCNGNVGTLQRYQTHCNCCVIYPISRC